MEECQAWYTDRMLTHQWNANADKCLQRGTGTRPPSLFSLPPDANVITSLSIVRGRTIEQTRSMTNGSAPHSEIVVALWYDHASVQPVKQIVLGT